MLFMTHNYSIIYYTINLIIILNICTSCSRTVSENIALKPFPKWDSTIERRHIKNSLNLDDSWNIELYRIYSDRWHDGIPRKIGVILINQKCFYCGHMLKMVN